jgi:hypothetical protein
MEKCEGGMAWCSYEIWFLIWFMALWGLVRCHHCSIFILEDGGDWFLSNTDNLLQNDLCHNPEDHSPDFYYYESLKSLCIKFMNTNQCLMLKSGTGQNEDLDAGRYSNSGSLFFQMVWFLSTLTMWRNVRCLGMFWQHSVMDGRIWMSWVLHSGRICTWLQSRYFLRMAAPSDHSHDYRCLHIVDQLP